MLVWTFVIAMTAIASAVLFYAGRAGAVNATPADASGIELIHHKNLLAEIDRAEADGQLGAEDALAARAELARDVIRTKERGAASAFSGGFSPLVAGLAIGAIVVLGIGTYALIGNPDLPGAPLDTRAAQTEIPQDVADAINKIEAQLAQAPDDVRGWQVLGPVYMHAGRYGDAVNAYRRILTLAGATPDSETDLAEALSMANGGVPSDEAMNLLSEAAAADPGHVRSRFYMAGEALRRGEYAEAVRLWQEVIALSDGSETWRPSADEALAVAQAGLAGGGDAETENAMIAGMVDKLATRLASTGGSVSEWTQLVRAYIVMGDRDRAQKAFDDARAAYPDAAERGDLDALAMKNGLK